MEEEWLPGILCVVCCPLGNGPPLHVPRPALLPSLPQATWRSGDGCPLDKEGKKEDLWTEAYACCLQRMAEASAGCSWETEGRGNGPTSQPSGAGIPDRNGKESKSVLCERMLAVEERYRTKTAYEHSSCPHVTHCLDKVAMHNALQLSHGTCSRGQNQTRVLWKEDCLPYSPGLTWWILALRMPGVRLKLHESGRKLPGGSLSPQI